MKFQLDMNRAPRWCGILQADGWDNADWSQVGIASPPDHEVMQSAWGDQRVVLTHDQDYGAMLVATKATGPSVVQVRSQDVRLESLAPLLIPTLRQYEIEQEDGALLIVDEAKSRGRVLPLAGKSGPSQQWQP